MLTNAIGAIEQAERTQINERSKFTYSRSLWVTSREADFLLQPSRRNVSLAFPLLYVLYAACRSKEIPLFNYTTRHMTKLSLLGITFLDAFQQRREQAFPPTCTYTVCALAARSRS